jgi:mannose-6-phosphate isomerase
MVWGGRRLAGQLGKPLPDDQPYGESWEVSDHPLHRSVVASGEHQGKTLRQLMEERPEELLGSAASTHTTFPWLIKFLDCQDWLSVQVHPDEQAVKELWPGEGSKTEAWFVLEAAPQSKIYAGLQPGVDEAVLRKAVAAGTVAECLYSFTPKAGDCVFLPAGTVHAVGGGVLMAEIQQTSDATFRLFDWNRRNAQGTSRPLHLEESIRAIHWDQEPVRPIPIPWHKDNAGKPLCLRLVTCPYFNLEYLETDSRISGPEKSLQAVLVLRGKGQLIAGETVEALVPGQGWVLPASLCEIDFVPHERLRLLWCRLP